MLLSAGIRDDSPCRDGTTSQCPEKLIETLVAKRFFLDFRERTCDTLEGVIYCLVYPGSVFRSQTIFCFPNIERRRLKNNVGYRISVDMNSGLHFVPNSPKFPKETPTF